MANTVYTSLDKADLEELISSYNEKLILATDKWRSEELAKEAYHDDIRPLVKKLAKFVEEWEELAAKEKLDDELTAARIARSGA